MQIHRSRGRIRIVSQSKRFQLMKKLGLVNLDLDFFPSSIVGYDKLQEVPFPEVHVEMLGHPNATP
jgi:hypothetical protein